MGFAILLMTSLVGCEANEDIQPTTVTYVHEGAEPYAYDVYVFTLNKVVYYDLANYAYSTNYDYFNSNGMLPSEENYSMEEYALNDDDWERIVAAINDNKFSKLPEDISNDGIMDVGSFYIQVKTDEEMFLSGGWGAGYGTSKNDKRFAEITKVLNDVIKGLEISNEAEEDSIVQYKTIDEIFYNYQKPIETLTNKLKDCTYSDDEEICIIFDETEGLPHIKNGRHFYTLTDDGVQGSFDNKDFEKLA